jgi:hypothetical protein
MQVWGSIALEPLKLMIHIENKQGNSIVSPKDGVELRFCVFFIYHNPNSKIVISQPQDSLQFI